MSDESQLQVRPKDSDSSLSLLRVSSGLVARGLRDAEAIERQASEPIDPLSETRRLAEEGDANAQERLGHAYSYGQGVPQDRDEAAKWYRKAAEQGNAEAQLQLGGLHQYGLGVPQDYAEAVNWYRKAAEQGHAEAQYNLGNAYYCGHGVPQDYAEAVRWFLKAVDNRDYDPETTDAMYRLGSAYYYGNGVPQDYPRAYYWLDFAAFYCGSGEKYTSARDEVAARMTPQQVAEAQRLAREWKPPT